jgi:hypothetical protein
MVEGGLCPDLYRQETSSARRSAPGLGTLGEPLSFTPGPAHLHVRNLSVADRQDVTTLRAIPAPVEPRRGADELVTELNELGVQLEVLPAMVDLPLQDRTGLIGAASGRCILPPQETTRDAAPFGVLGEERGEGNGITPVECLNCGPKLVDQGRLSMTSGLWTGRAQPGR